MNDRAILKWYHLNNAKVRQLAGDHEPHFYFLTEGSPQGRKQIWLAYRTACEIHLRIVTKEVFDSFRATVMRGFQKQESVAQITDASIDPKAPRKQFPVPPTPDKQRECIRFYWKPPRERDRQNLSTPEFYLQARGNGMFYLGHRNHYEFYLRQIPKDFYEALKRDILWRWKQVGIEHLVGETHLEHHYDHLLLDYSDPVTVTTPSSPPASYPDSDNQPPSFRRTSWEWRNRFGPRFPPK